MHPPGGGKLPKNVVVLTRGKETSSGRGGGVGDRGCGEGGDERIQEVEESYLSLHYLAR